MKSEHPYDALRQLLLARGRSLWTVNDRCDGRAAVIECEAIFANGKIFILQRTYHRKTYKIEGWDCFVPAPCGPLLE